MNPDRSLSAADASEEISALITTLHETGQRLEALTAGEVDTVADREGQTFVLRRAQEQLRHIEADRQAAILNALPAHIALLDAQGTIVSVNEAWRRFGVANATQGPGHGTGLNYLDVCDRAHGAHSAGAHQAAGGIRAVLAGEAMTFSMEYPCHAPKQQRWFQMTVAPLEAEHPNGAVVMHIDITAKTLAEESLRASQLRFQAVIENVSDVIALTHVDGTLKYVSPSMKEMGGYEPGELIGRNLFEFMHPDDLKEGLKVMDRIQSSPGLPVRAEQRFRHKDGTWLTLEATAKNMAHLPAIGGVIVNVRNATERKRTEAALKHSESRYRSLFENMLEGYAYCETIFEQDRLRDFVYLEVNGAFEKLTGLKNVVGRKVSEVIPGLLQSNPEIFEVYGRVARTGKSEKFETFIEPLGIWMAVTVYSHERGHFIAVVDNITGRKQSEESLRASAVEFRALAEAMPQMVWITRPDGWNIYFSQQWMDYTGLTQEESLGHGWIKPFHPADQQRAQAAWQHATHTITIYAVECRLRRADGVYRWWLMRGVPQQDAAGKVLKWFGTCTDIHELKSAELGLSAANLALRESDEKFRQLADNITDVFWIRSPDLSVVHYVSPAFEQIWGRPVESIYGRPETWADFIHADDRQRVQAAYATLSAGAPSLDINYRILRPSSEIRWVRVRGFPVLDAGKKLLRLIGIVSDITERKRIEEALALTHNRLLEVSRQAGMAEVATNVLHNVGNVLNSVNVSAGLVIESVRKSRTSGLPRVVDLLAQHRDDLGTYITQDPQGKNLPNYLAHLAQHVLADQEATVKELESLRQNVEHIKEIVAMQQGYAKSSGVKELVQISDLVEYSLRMNEEALRRHGMQVVREFDPRLPPINIEMHKVIQILVNLVRNAKQACNESGVADKRITVRTARSGDSMKVSVIDNGMGISPENLTQIFRHGFTTRKDGHGFGLHSGALAAKEMNGNLSVHSDGVGKGATFTLELPIQETAP